MYLFHDRMQIGLPEVDIHYTTNLNTLLVLQSNRHCADIQYSDKMCTESSIFQVKRSGTLLSQQVYAFLTYVQTAEQEARGKGKDKDPTKAGNLTKVTLSTELSQGTYQLTSSKQSSLTVTRQ